ncbi:MAG: DEAD/DEAH box helicase [Puniceicoccales bacterium]|jgi:hypothetical protein|nr:DEAD/DEAH box helicase [Puniceicoccales bacterium]
MSFNTAIRNYKESALVLWLERLSGGWEAFFEPRVLEAARAIYRRSEVREISVFDREASVFLKWEEGMAHVVLEWVNGRLLWRTSLGDGVVNDALAAAGVYEIEELLADESAMLSLCDGKSGDRVVPPPKSAPAEVASPSPPVESGRGLELAFSMDGCGDLLCVPKWVEARGGRRLAYDAGAAAVRLPLGKGESENLLRLAARARRCGFVFDRGAAGWRLAGVTEVARFVRQELRVEWARRWRMSGVDALAVLARELPPLNLEMFAESVPDVAGSGVGGGGAPRGKGGAFCWRWRFRIGGDVLPGDVTRRLMASPENPVWVPGRGIARMDERQRAAVAEWGAEGEVLPQYAFLSLFGEERARVVADASLRAWRAALLREPGAVALPRGVSALLRPYQARGVAWLAHMFALGTHPLLADEMGLGKTLQTLALLLSAPSSGPALVVCPASVVPVWVGEAARFFPGTVVRVLGRGCNWEKFPEGVQLWVSSYAQLLRNRDLLAGTEFDCAVLDEAQFAKNPKTKVAQACFAIRARRRLALTGTPVENHPLDLWSVFRFLMPGLLGSRAAFEKRLGRDAEGAVALLARQVRPFVLRRTKAVVADDLPPKLIIPLACPMGGVQREIYRRLVEEGIAALGNVAPEALVARGETMHMLALLLRLRQAACDPGLLPGHAALGVSVSGKVGVLMERLGEILGNGHRVVVFSQFVRFLERVRGELGRVFPRVPVFMLTGATVDRAVPVESFQEGTGASVMLASLRAGGTGITLHSASYVFLMDPWWNPAVEAQAVDRIHRLGQRKTTFVYRMIAADTVEARIEALKGAKSELFAQMVGDLPDMSDWGAHFSSLRALVS